MNLPSSDLEVMLRRKNKLSNAKEEEEIAQLTEEVLQARCIQCDASISHFQKFAQYQTYAYTAYASFNFLIEPSSKT